MATWIQSITERNVVPSSGSDGQVGYSVVTTGGPFEQMSVALIAGHVTFTAWESLLNGETQSGQVGGHLLHYAVAAGTHTEADSDDAQGVPEVGDPWTGLAPGNYTLVAGETDDFSSYDGIQKQFSISGVATPPTGTPILTGYQPTTTSAKIFIDRSPVTGADGYEYQINGTGGWTDIGDVANFTLTGLTPDTSRTVVVRPYNTEGAGTPSSSITVWTFYEFDGTDDFSHGAWTSGYFPDWYHFHANVVVADGLLRSATPGPGYAVLAQEAGESQTTIIDTDSIASLHGALFRAEVSGGMIQQGYAVSILPNNGGNGNAEIDKFVDGTPTMLTDSIALDLEDVGPVKIVCRTDGSNVVFDFYQMDGDWVLQDTYTDSSSPLLSIAIRGVYTSTNTEGLATVEYEDINYFDGPRFAFAYEPKWANTAGNTFRALLVTEKRPVVEGDLVFSLYMDEHTEWAYDEALPNFGQFPTLPNGAWLTDFDPPYDIDDPLPTASAALTPDMRTDFDSTYFNFFDYYSNLSEEDPHVTDDGDVGLVWVRNPSTGEKSVASSGGGGGSANFYGVRHVAQGMFAPIVYRGFQYDPVLLYVSDLDPPWFEPQESPISLEETFNVPAGTILLTGIIASTGQVGIDTGYAGAADTGLTITPKSGQISRLNEHLPSGQNWPANVVVFGWSEKTAVEDGPLTVGWDITETDSQWDDYGVGYRWYVIAMNLPAAPAEGVIVAHEDDDSGTIGGTVSIDAAVAVTEEEDVAAIVGVMPGVISATEEEDACEIIADISAILSVVEEEDQGAALGGASMSGNIAVSEEEDHAALFSVYIGQIAAVEEEDSASIIATAFVPPGAIAANEEDDAAALSGTVSASAVVALVEQDDGAEIIGHVPLQGAIAAAEQDDSTTIVGAVFGPVVGQIEAVEADDTCLIIGNLLAYENRYYGVVLGDQLPHLVVKTGGSTGRPIEVRIHEPSVHQANLDVILGLGAIIDYLKTQNDEGA